MTLCPACRTRDLTQWSICKACAEQLHDDLDEIPWLVDQLDVTLARQHRVGSSSGARITSSAPGLPLDVGAAAVRHDLFTTLTTWTMTIAWAQPTTPDITAMAKMLLARHGQLIVRPDASRLHRAIRRATDQARRCVFGPPEQEFLGRCPNCGDTDLYAEPGTTTVACPDCRSGHDVNGLRAALTQALEDLSYTAAELADLAPYLEQAGDRDRFRKRINQWAARRRVLPSSWTSDGQPRFRFGDIRAQLGEDVGRTAGPVSPSNALGVVALQPSHAVPTGIRHQPAPYRAAAPQQRR